MVVVICETTITMPSLIKVLPLLSDLMYLCVRSKPFFYNIGGSTYTLDDIKHGMLRGNKRKPGHLQRVLSGTDPKLSLLPVVSFSFFQMH